MPCTITHAYFGIDVFNKLDKKTQAMLTDYQEYIKTFSQGPDFFYFYNISNFNKGKAIRDFGDFVHQNKTQEFFIKLITYIKENNLENNPEIISFLYGFINHYILDSITHPFIIYKTGIYDKHKKDSFKYNGLHNDMESYIDAYFIFQNEQTLPKLFKPHKFCFNINNFSNELSNLIDNVFNDVYNVKNISSIYFNSIKQARKFYYFYRYDKIGLKKILYKIVDKISPKIFKKKEFLSYHQNISIKNHYLNLEKREWNHPLDDTEFSTLSFIELYIIAINKAVKTINETNNFLYNNTNINHLKQVFNNTSYASGKNCELGHNFKYFEF